MVISPVNQRVTEKMSNLRENEQRGSIYSQAQYEWSDIETPMDGDEDDFVPQEKWLNPSDVLVAMIGGCIGYDDLWRFPMFCRRHGGAFLVTYFFSVLVISIPMVVLELTLSQFTSTGLYHNMDLTPAFKGIGISSGMMVAIFLIHYNVLISWAIRYMAASLQSEIPWRICGDWSSELCETKLTKVNNFTCLMDPSLILYPNGTCYNTTTNVLYGISDKAVAKFFKIESRFPAEDYLYTMLPFKQTNNDFISSNLHWDLILCFFLAWGVQFFFLISGLSKSNTFIKFNVIFVYIILVILFIFGIMQEGSDDGVRFFMTVNLKKFTNLEVWKDALFEAAFSFNILLGIHSLLGSKNKFHVNLIRDSILLIMIDSLTSLYAGLVIFFFVGSFAKVRQVDIASLFSPHRNYMFVILPQAFTMFPFASVLSILYFAMLVMLGLKVIYPVAYSFILLIKDTSSFLQKNEFLITSFVCCVSFMMGMLMTTDAGTRSMSIFSNVISGWNSAVLLGLYCFSVMIYGPFRISKDIDIMIADASECTFILPWRYLKWWFISCWCVIIPLYIVIIAIWEIIEAVQSGTSTAAQIFTAFLRTSITLIPLPIVFVRNFIKARGNFMQRIKTIFRPSVKWGPYLVKHRRLVTYVRNFHMNPRHLYDHGV